MTDWNAYGLTEIWDMVRDDVSDRIERHIRAWRSMAALCEDYSVRLSEAADRLAEHWSPRSAAGAAFLGQLTGFAAKVATAADSARLTGTAVTMVASSLTDARIRVRDLVTQQGQYAGAEATVVTTARAIAWQNLDRFDDSQVLAVAHDPSFAAAIERAGAPMVPEDWRAVLDESARQIMSDTDRAVAQARTYLRTQETVDVPADSSSPATPPKRKTSGPEGPPPPIFDPPRPAPPGLRSHRNTRHASTTTPGPHWTDEPILASDHPPTTPPAPAGAPTPAPAPISASPAPRVSALESRALSPSLVPAAPRPIARPSARPLSAAPSERQTSHPEAVASGPATRPSGFFAGTPAGAGNLRGPGDSGTRTRRGYEPTTDDWGAREGVPPVIEAPPEPNHTDPGPNVIGG